MRMEWHGDEITGRVLRAAQEAIDETTAAAAQEAQGDHWWQHQTGHLEQETISEPATMIENGVVAGRFGTTERRGFYGLILEYRRPFLRPIADRVFPTVIQRLQKKL